MRKYIFRFVSIALLAVVIGVPVAVASASEGENIHNYAVTFLFIAIILIMAKLSSLVERVGQPAVLGELVIGVILGNLILFGINFFEPIKEDPIITFLAELGVVILLFQIGLESNIQKMKEVGFRAFLVAFLGVVASFVLGTYLIGPWLMPGLDFNAYLFIGAVLTATSVGITARIFKDLKKIQTIEAQIVLEAAVIDDVFGIIILAVISALVTVGGVNIGLITWITAKAILFLIGAIVIGQISAPKLSRFFATINTGTGMKFTVAISFGLILAFLAQKIGLAPIIGAFAAGLVLDPVHFNYFKDAKIVEDIKESVTNMDKPTRDKILTTLEPHAHRHIEDLIEPVGLFLVPIFFVMTGMGVQLDALANLPVLFVALGITITAFASKIISGLAAGKANKAIVGLGMIPRGEVGLVFAMTGKNLNVISDQIFSTIIIMVILTTLLTPPVLTYLLKKQE